MPLSGFLIRWTGPRPAMFTGCAIFSLGTGLTYFTLEMVMTENLIFTIQLFSSLILGSSMGGFHLRVHLSLRARHRSYTNHDHWHEMVS